MSYGFDNNDDISTMSLIPKFAQLSFTYYLSLYCSNLRNFCEFLNWFLIAHFLFWVYGWQILGIINQRFRWMQINPFPLSIKTYTYHMHHVTIYSSAVMTCNFQYLAISFFVTTTFNEHPVMGRNGCIKIYRKYLFVWNTMMQSFYINILIQQIFNKLQRLANLLEVHFPQ